MAITRRNFIARSGIFTTAALMNPGCASIGLTSQKPIRFGWISDLHYGNIPSRGSRYYRESAGKLEEFVKVMNDLKPDFVIETGDLKDLGKSEKESLIFVKDIEAIYSKCEVPRYHVLGNHDMDSISKEQFLSHVSNADKIAEAHYSFIARGTKFIVLDANFNEDMTDYCRGDFDWGKAYIPPKQVNWLNDELKNTDLPVVVFCHQCLNMPGNPHGVGNAEEIRSILEQSGRVKAVFQGHYHKGAYSVKNGIPYFTLNAAIEGSGASSNAYAEVTIFPSGDVTVSGFRKTPSRIFAKN